MPIDTMFPHLADAAKMLDPKARFFTVNDTTKIVVEGLEAVEYVEIDGIALPMMEARTFWKNDPGKEPETVQHMVPLFQVQDIPGFGRCLIRSVYSNHGEWQIGSNVTVVGDWADGPSEEFVSTFVVDPILKAKDVEIEKREQALAGAVDAIAEKEAELQSAASRIAELEAILKDNGVELESESMPPRQQPMSPELDPELDKDAIKVRAKELGISTVGKNSEKLLQLIKAKEDEGK